MRWPTAWKAWRSTCCPTSSPRSPSTRARRPPAWSAGSATSAAPSPPTPGSYEFAIPDCADPRAITSYALQRLDVVIAAYQAFLDQIRGRDDVSFALVVGLLAAETHRRADVAAALAGPGIPA